jgi:uncharacterized protein YndB with AHSA1/START domain
MTTETITMERTYDAIVEDVWELWTTKQGIESWWGPDGFSVEVRSIDLRPGGELLYAMTATGPAQMEFMKSAGMPLTQEVLMTYGEIEAPRRLVMENLVDFVAGVEPYWVTALVELEPAAEGTCLRLLLDPMHDEDWTKRAVMGWESELGKLERLLATRVAS